jgi:hypothetical protein
MASSTSMFQFIRVRMARSWAGALRAVTRAVRMRIWAVAGLLQPVQGDQQGFERAVGQRQGNLVDLVLLKRLNPCDLVDAFGFIAEQHGVAVKGDAHLVGMCVAGMYRVGVNLRCGHAAASAARTSLRWVLRNRLARRGLR